MYVLRHLRLFISYNIFNNNQPRLAYIHTLAQSINVLQLRCSQVARARVYVFLDQLPMMNVICKLQYPLHVLQQLLLSITGGL
jgi:hypothetical protein